MSALLDAALGYCRLGWPLVPIRPGAKKPPLTEHSVYEASTDPEVIRHWIDRWPELNWAVATGTPGPQVLDIDDKARTPRELLETGAPESITRRGPHLHFAGTEAKTIEFSWGELRGRGSYALVPPSIVDGKEHVWLNAPNGGPLPPVPALLIGEGKGAGRGQYAPPARPIIAGEGRWPYLKDIAVRLVRGGIVDEELLLAMIGAAFTTGCETQPPPAPGALQKLAAWAANSDIAERERGEETQPIEMRDELARLLRLQERGIHVQGIRLMGNGPSAALDIDLSNGLELYTERFGDLWTHTGLAKFVTQSTGIDAGAITKADATRASALIRKLANISRETRTGDIGREHGHDFLERAPVERFQVNEQSSRYSAFAKIKERGDAFSAEHSLVLLDEQSGERYVVCGHLFEHVRHRGEVAHPAELARRMRLAGWARKGKRGYIKATSPTTKHTIKHGLWLVPAGWEES
jgi:hypothetical protein